MNTSINDAFVHKVLKCMGNQKLTKEEIEEKYDLLYVIPKIPLSRHDIGRAFQRSATPQSPTVNIEQKLLFLMNEEYIRREITRFTYKALDKDTYIYFVTQKGKNFLASYKQT